MHERKVKCEFANMRQLVLSIFCSLLIFNKMCQCLKAEKLVYQRDVSEHCRRQVFPSVFLGAHVMEAKSQVLHFSLLEEPYSCYISVRTEPGSFIMLVFQVGYSLRDSICRADESVVTVHDMGETFGGYWGPIPLYTRDKEATEKYYTLKTTPPTEMVTPKIFEYDDSDSKSDEATEHQRSEMMTPQTEYTLVITNDVPLIRLTGELVDIDKKNRPDKLLETEENFDFDDTLPKPELGYLSTIMPVMRLSFKHPAVVTDGNNTDQEYDTNNETIDFEPRYQLQYNLDGFTLDSRLTYGSEYKSTTRSNNYKLNRLLKFKKQKRPLFSPKITSYTKSIYDYKHRNDLWSQIESLLRNVSQTTDEPLDKNKDDFSSLMGRIADRQHNYSIYLLPNLFDFNNSDELRRKTSQNVSSFTPMSITEVIQSTQFDPISVESTTKSHQLNNRTKNTKYNVNNSEVDILKHDFQQTALVSLQSITETSFMEKSIKETKSATNKSIVTSSIYNMNVTTAFSSLKNVNISYTEDNILKNTEANISTDITNKRYSTVSTILPTKAMIGSLVNHGSWENIVQVAPKIAGILSDPKMITKPLRKSLKGATAKRIEKSLHISTKSKYRRKKRSIQAIPIEMAKPHYFTTVPNVVTTSEPMFHAQDMLDFAKLVELEDDDLHGPVVLRDLRQVVGKKLFDLCDKMQNKTKFRYVQLLNTSRIVIAINNYTWKSLTIIATPVRVLTKKTSRCDCLSIECQISGARVCVDKLNACDDIPNCGVCDNYDEDRLMCGIEKGVHPNVFLAAFTFVVVILTLLYIVYYWLKRCVPKVSDAFFIYTDGTENLLRLETVMKSPVLQHDESIRKLQGYLFDDSAISYEPTKDKKIGIFKRLKNVFTRQKEDDSQLSGELNNTLLGRMFSFPQIEIHKMMRPVTLERSIQTGESLEMTFVDERPRTSAFIEKKGKIEQGLLRKSSESLLGVHDESSYQSLQDNELYMLKFFRDSRLSSMLWDEGNMNVIKREPTAIGPNDSPKISGEYELTSTVYDRGTNPMEMTTMKSSDDLKYKWVEIKSDTLATTSEDSSEMAGPSGLLGKRLRFDENLTTISEGEITDVVERIQEDKDTANPQIGTTGRDFIRFWGKKTQQKKKTPNYK